MNEPLPRPTAPAPGRFASTQWSLILLARDSGDTPEARSALADLCARYWYPLYAYVRRQGYAVEQAEDLTQEFFARFLAQDGLQTVDRSRGKFRTFLLACCRNFLANERDHARAQKRGGGRQVLSLDFPSAAARYRGEASASETPEQSFARGWALTVLDQVLDQLRRDYETDGKGALFAQLKATLVGGAESPTYARIASALGSTEDAVKKAAQRLRQHYRALLREHIAATVDGPDAVEEEIRDLFVALSS